MWSKVADIGSYLSMFGLGRGYVYFIGHSGYFGGPWKNGWFWTNVGNFQAISAHFVTKIGHFSTDVVLFQTNTGHFQLQAANRPL